MSELAEVSTAEVAGNADANPAAPTGGESAPPAPEVGTPVTPEEKARNQERINQLTRARYESETRAEKFEREARELRQQLAQLQAKPQPVAPVIDKFPTLEEHGYDEAKYHEAVQGYFQRQQAQILSEDELVDKALEKYTERQQEQTRQTGWETRQAKFVESKPDFIEKVYRHPKDGGPVITDDMLAVIAESDVGPDLAYHLAENVGISEQIARLPADLQKFELGRIAALLAKPASAAPVVPIKPPVSQAPAPAPTIQTAESADEKDPSQMSAKQFAAWRRKYMVKR